MFFCQMIEFKIKTYRKKMEVPDKITEGFKHPMIYYLSHKDDPKAFFVTFIIVDFQRRAILHIVSYFPENIDKMKNFPDGERFVSRPFVNPHCSVEIGQQEDFYTFMEGANYFFYINYRKNIMRAYLAEEFVATKLGKIKEMGATFFKDSEDASTFYLVAEERRDNTKEGRLHFLKSNTDMSRVEKIYKTPFSSCLFVPHVSRKFKNYLLNSEFSSTQYKNLMTGTIFNNRVELNRYVYGEIYKEFCTETNRKYSQENFFKENEINGFNDRFQPEFDTYCKTRGSDIIEICRNDQRYSFSVMPGKISILDLEKLTMERYDTTFCAPGHFEVDEKEGVIYSSSHNFIRGKNNHFLGPAAIDKFIFRDGKFIKSGVFTDPTGYRFTSHRVFYYENRPYICTIGHPNRLFIIDAQEMKTYYFVDLFEDVLSDKIDVASFLNNVGHVFEGRLIYMALEASFDGEYVCIVGYKNLYIFSFSERKIILSIPFFMDYPFEDGISSTYFHRKTTHVNYLY